MKWQDWLENWGMSSLTINLGILETEWTPQDADRDAAWDMYVELLTRITTQPLPKNAGDDAAALQSVYDLFSTTRGLLHQHGRKAMEFAKLAVLILNRKIRPFTAKWHPVQEAGKLEEHHEAFRQELTELREVLLTYTRMLGEMVGIAEDLTAMEPDS